MTSAALLSTIEGTVDFVSKAHKGQVDKQNAPYVLHVLRVGSMLWPFGEDFVIAGLLHDVIEDTPTTEKDLWRLGASPTVVRAVKSVTKRASEASLDEYERSLRRAMKDPVGLWVKAADVADNASRISGVPDKATRDRLRVKYAMAVNVLRQAIPGFDPRSPLRDAALLGTPL